MKKNYFFLIIFILLFSLSFSQTTLLNQDFSGESLGTISTSSSSYPFSINHTGHSNCDGAGEWQVVASHNGAYGTAPSGMSGYRAGVRYESGCTTHQSLNTEYWTTTETGDMTIEFSYSFYNYGSGYPADSGSEFWVYLMKWNGSSWAVSSLLVNHEDASASVDYSSTISVTSGEHYRLRVYYYGD